MGAVLVVLVEWGPPAPTKVSPAFILRSKPGPHRESQNGSEVPHQGEQARHMVTLGLRRSPPPPSFTSPKP